MNAEKRCVGCLRGDDAHFCDRYTMADWFVGVAQQGHLPMVSGFRYIADPPPWKKPRRKGAR